MQFEVNRKRRVAGYGKDHVLFWAPSGSGPVPVCTQNNSTTIGYSVLLSKGEVGGGAGKVGKQWLQIINEKILGGQ